MRTSHLSALVATLGLVSCAHPPPREPFDVGLEPEEIATRSAEKKQRPDVEGLMRLRLPSDPTRREVIDYIAAVYALSQNQRSYHSGDPQPALLARVGNDYLEDLIYSTPRYGNARSYGLDAITWVAEEKDKGTVIANLPWQPALAKVLYRKGWCLDAEPELVRILAEARDGALGADTIRCLSELERSDTYPALARQMVHQYNAATVYRIIKDLPGIDLREALVRAWERKRMGRWPRGELLPPVLELGYLPAFDFLMEALRKDPKEKLGPYRPRDLARRFAPIQGTDEDLLAWYDANRDRLFYDEALQKYGAMRP